MIIEEDYEEEIVMDLLELKQRYDQNNISVLVLHGHEIVAMSNGTVNISIDGNLAMITSDSNIHCLFRGKEYKSFYNLWIRCGDDYHCVFVGMDFPKDKDNRSCSIL